MSDLPFEGVIGPVPTTGAGVGMTPYDPDPRTPDDEWFGDLYVGPDRPRSAAAGIIIAAAVVVIVGAFLVLAFAVFG